MRKKRIAAILPGLLLCLVLLCGSVLFVLYFTPFYGWNVKGMQLEEKTGLTREQLQENYNQIIHYNNPLYRGEMELPDFEMTEEFREHFRVVKDIFYGIWICFLVGIVLLAGCIRWIRKHQLYEFLLWAPIFQALILAGAGAGMMLGWDRLFTVFHEVVFPGQQWRFDPAVDPLITILPETWFLYCFLLILALYILGGAACVAVWGWRKRRNRKIHESRKPTGSNSEG